MNYLSLPLFRPSLCAQKGYGFAVLVILHMPYALSTKALRKRMVRWVNDYQKGRLDILTLEARVDPDIVLVPSYSIYRLQDLESDLN